MIISWKPPLDSGGVDVSNYIIEKRDTNRDMWTTVTSATTKTTCKVGVPPKPPELLCSVNIISGPKYFTFFLLVKFEDVGMFFFSDPEANRGKRIHHEDFCGEYVWHQ